MNWPKSLRIKRNFSLRELTSFKVGGKALFFLEPENTQELGLALRFAREKGIKVYILGAGSNLLVKDAGVNGLVIRLTAPYFSGISLDGSVINSGSGVSLFRLIKFSSAHGLSGLEFLTGIPASLGGALMMNAGCWGREISSLVKELSVMDYMGNVTVIGRPKAGFRYRGSKLGRYIILGAKLKLKKEKEAAIRKRIKTYAKKKAQSQDLTFPSAGCIFKNPDFESAGRLIELCGFKGKSLRGALISRKHANFILNVSRAKAKDILSLIRAVKKAVRMKFKISLRPEIKIWG